jgi:hypothetical protein
MLNGENQKVKTNIVHYGNSSEKRKTTLCGEPSNILKDSTSYEKVNCTSCIRNFLFTTKESNIVRRYWRVRLEQINKGQFIFKRTW